MGLTCKYSVRDWDVNNLFGLKKLFLKYNTAQIFPATVNSLDHYRAQNVCPTGKLNCKSHCGKLLCCAPNSSYLSNCTWILLWLIDHWGSFPMAVIFVFRFLNCGMKTYHGCDLKMIMLNNFNWCLTGAVLILFWFLVYPPSISHSKPELTTRSLSEQIV